MSTSFKAPVSARGSIVVTNVSKQFTSPDIWAVKDISFDAGSGEIVGLIGENGAGKSTLLRIMATILSATSGSVSINGFRTDTSPRAVRSSIGILFAQQDGLYERLSARENIIYFAQLNGMSSQTAHRRIGELSEMLDMGDFLGKPAGTFSTGMRQKTLIARTVIHNPDILMLDEPTTGLDITSSRNIHSFISWCREQNKTVFFSSHDLHSVGRLCDRVHILHKGRLISSVDTGHIPERRSLEEYYFSIKRNYE